MAAKCNVNSNYSCDQFRYSDRNVSHSCLQSTYKKYGWLKIRFSTYREGTPALFPFEAALPSTFGKVNSLVRCLNFWGKG